jgi:DNA-binding MarR family transcriptional regulator
MQIQTREDFARKKQKDAALVELQSEFPEVDPEAIQATLAFVEVAAQRSLIEEKLYGGFQLSRGRFEILMLLRRQADRSLAPSILAQFAGVSRATMTQFLDVLERDGLICRKADPKDRRASLVSLTAKGEKLVNKILPKHFQWLTRFVKILSPSKRRELRKMLQELKVGMEGMV